MTKKAPTPSIFDVAHSTPEPTATRSGSCPSLTHKSTLTYSVAETNGDTLYQLTGNSASGHFSQEWVSLSAIKGQLGGSTFNSIPLQPLFKNRSLNSSGFLLAVLLEEGLVRLIPGKRRVYQLGSAPIGTDNTSSNAPITENSISRISATENEDKPVKAKRKTPLGRKKSTATTANTSA